MAENTPQTKYVIYFPGDDQFIEQTEPFVTFPGREDWLSLDMWASVSPDEIINGSAVYEDDVYPCILMQVTDEVVDNTTTLMNLRKYRCGKKLKVASMLPLLPRVRTSSKRLAFQPLNVRFKFHHTCLFP